MADKQLERRDSPYVMDNYDPNKLYRFVDKDGNVFKAAADVEAWLAENEQQDDNSLNGTSIKDLIDAGRIIHPDTLGAYNDAIANVEKSRRER